MPKPSREQTQFKSVFEAVLARGRDVTVPGHALERKTARVVLAVMPGGDDLQPRIERRITGEDGVTDTLSLSMDDQGRVWTGAWSDADAPGTPHKTPGMGPVYIDHLHHLVTAAGFIRQEAQ
jgi:hypothetical protein